MKKINNNSVVRLKKNTFKLFENCNIYYWTLFFLKIFFIFIYTTLIINGDKFFISTYNRNKKVIFSFWEPLGAIPGYIRLCIKTWEKYLPDYNIKILDYKKLKNYLGKSLFNKIICKEMPLSMQADAIRVALLKKFGGLWMDTDTIILSNNFINQIKDNELVMIGEEKSKFQYIGFIYSYRNSRLINKWFYKIIDNINYYRKNIKKNIYLNNVEWPKKKTDFFYLGYQIIDPLLKDEGGKNYLRIDSSEINCFPEKYAPNLSTLNHKEKYKLFYFEKRNSEHLLDKSKNLILLHNSWTPPKYKKMSEKEFLKQDILLSNLFIKILK